MSGQDNDTFCPSVLRQALRKPLLTQEEEGDLVRRWQEQSDNKALTGLIEPHLRLVMSIARHFRHYGLPHEDLSQEGTLGLMHAATRYKQERGVRFATYAQWWIRSYMTEYVLRNWSLIRIGTTRSQKTLFFNLRRVRNKIDGVSGESMSQEAIDHIAKSLKVTPDEVRSMEMRLSGRDSSLNVTIGEEGKEERTDFLVSDDPNPEQLLETKQIETLRSTLLHDALDTLSERERRIVEMRKLREDPLTLEEVGAQLSISKERVRQIENRALGKLREQLEKGAGDVRLI